MTTIDNARIRRVQGSYLAAAADPRKFSEIFYGRLFDRHPDTRALFPDDMAPQHHKFGDMITHLVTVLPRIDSAADELRAMGARHVRYGTRDAHYDAVGEALLWTLDRLHPAFTPAMRDAWTEAYAIIARRMREGAHGIVHGPTVHR